MRTRVGADMPCPSAIAMALEEADIVHLVPSFQRGAECNPADTRADAGDLAVGGDISAVFLHHGSWVTS